MAGAVYPTCVYRAGSATGYIRTSEGDQPHAYMALLPHDCPCNLQAFFRASRDEPSCCLQQRVYWIPPCAFLSLWFSSQQPLISWLTCAPSLAALQCWPEPASEAYRPGCPWCSFFFPFLCDLYLLFLCHTRLVPSSLSCWQCLPPRVPLCNKSSRVPAILLCACLKQSRAILFPFCSTTWSLAFL